MTFSNLFLWLLAHARSRRAAGLQAAEGPREATW